MAKKTEPIKECLQFRGPPDPLRGDEIYQRVRDAAQEALDAIFDSSLMSVATSAVAEHSFFANFLNQTQGMSTDQAPQESIDKRDGSAGFEWGVSSSFSNRLSITSGEDSSLKVTVSFFWFICDLKLLDCGDYF
jgi:hypothetical protein